jgi:hypothetical protein
MTSFTAAAGVLLAALHTHDDPAGRMSATLWAGALLLTALLLVAALLAARALARRSAARRRPCPNCGTFFDRGRAGNCPGCGRAADDQSR